ncbi:MAG TPA: restriction endonuclease subunit S [Tardiphaga sp.]
MAGEWIECALADACSSIDYRLTASASDREVGPRFLRITDIVTGHIDWNAVPHVAANEAIAAKYRLHDGDIVLARTGASTGASAYVQNPPPAMFASYLVRLQAKPEFDARFLAYYLRSEDFWTFIRGVLGDKSAQPNASASTMTKAPLRAPKDKAEQRAIAHILGTLDDKIELNRRMNETLEAMARALFKSWFVDFDPVRAKAEGRDPGLPQPLADLFPDSFEDSALEEIPSGWRVGCVDDEFGLTMGQSPPGDTYNEAGHGLPFYQGRTDFGFRFPTRRVYCTAPTRLAKRGDTLISVRAPVGDINMAAEDCAIGRGVAAARHKTGSRSYSYQFMRSQEEVFDRFEAEGTVFGSIGKKDFHAISCVVPPHDLVVEFERRLAPVDGRIEVTEHETQALAALRDALLPKLISGELRVNDAERLIEVTA